MTNAKNEALAIAAAAKRLAAEGLIAEAEQIEKDLAKARRPEPATIADRWAIDIRFQPRGKVYEFLVLRVGNRYYTTGTTLASSVFDSWAEFLRWLDEETASHSAMIPLISNYKEPAALEGNGWNGAGRI